jgi:hypothetical protein
LFAIAGRLELKQGGPDIAHGLGLTVPRRSLYFQHASEKQMEFLKIFNCASVVECYQRKENIQPQQALALANSELAIRCSRLLARRIAETHFEPAAFTIAAFERVLTRGPTSAELAECLDFLRGQTAQHSTRNSTQTGDDAGATPASEAGLRARENLVLVLFNHHDFVTVR